MLEKPAKGTNLFCCLQSMEETQKIANEYSALQQIHEILNEDVENFMSEKEAMEKSNVQLSQQVCQVFVTIDTIVVRC